MKTFAIEFGGQNFGQIRAYNSRTQANSNGNGATIISDSDDLMNAQVTAAMMVSLYNHYNPDNKVLKFTDRPTAVKRIMSLAEAKAEIIQLEKTQPDINKKVEPVSKVMEKLKAEKADGAARVSKLNGKKLTASTQENPRREGTHGHKSMQLILDNPGITYEKFIELGGRANDLRWDMDHNNVIVA